MLTLYLVRHGPTLDSEAGIYAGTRDAPLTAKGEAVAARLAEVASAWRLTTVYASPLQRAQQTAAPTARAAGLTVTVLPGLAELDHGRWEGLSPEACRRDDAAHFERWQADPAQVGPPGGGETATLVLQRAARAIATIRATTPHGAVLAVAHKSTIRILLCHMLGRPLRDFKRCVPQATGAINVLQWHDDGQPHDDGQHDDGQHDGPHPPDVVRVNDISYLPAALRSDDVTSQ